MSDDNEPILTGTVLAPDGSRNGQRRGGLRRRFGRWLLFGPRNARHEVPRVRYVPSDPETTFTTPALNDTYDFTVIVHWTWEALDQDWDEHVLADSVEEFKADVWEQICVTVRCVLRSFPAHQPAAAETALNHRLGAIMQQNRIVAAGARWTARAEVTPHDQVKAQLQQDWSNLRALEVERGRAEQIIGDRAALAERWRLLLVDLGIGAKDDSFTAPFVGRYLMRLAAQPELAAEVVERLAEHREAKDAELLAALQDAIQGKAEVNLFEADSSHDLALRRLMSWAGLSTPDDPT